MALYAITDKVIRGTPTAAAAAVETYLETVTNTKSVYFVNVVGDQNYVTYIILHEA
jgi:hypothetical protein